MYIMANGSARIFAGAINLVNGQILENREAYIYNGFLVVFEEDREGSPTWYSLSQIESLEEVIV